MAGSSQEEQKIKEWLRQQGATSIFIRHNTNRYPHLFFRLRREEYDVPICARKAHGTIKALQALIKRRETRQEVRTVG